MMTRPRSRRPTTTTKKRGGGRDPKWQPKNTHFSKSIPQDGWEKGTRKNSGTGDQNNSKGERAEKKWEAGKAKNKIKQKQAKKQNKTTSDQQMHDTQKQRAQCPAKPIDQPDCITERDVHEHGAHHHSIETVSSKQDPPLDRFLVGAFHPLREEKKHL
ncbi:hypothetical protein JTE90_013358 [Oedothorax gibbosus]|uniref:Uncharacterized protein n=1 Tax=Oedothorax gibbosus TaxID=931172 RepID=A0AAV6TUX2_9ARAC|nr:hypothetical protein JTE90_013358 [Oedothorax gibbosus]